MNHSSYTTDNEDKAVKYLTITMMFAPLAMAIFPGCDSYEPANLNVYRNDRAVGDVSRVVFVQLEDRAGYPDIANRMTEAIQEAITDRGLFRVDIIPATHPELRYLDMRKRDAYTIRELVEIRKALRCDAILFGKMSSYKPYPSTKIGLYLRLIDLKDGKLAWAVDDVWDTTSSKTVARIENFYFDKMRDSYDPARSEMGIMSTDGFQRFVAYEIIQSMDPNSKPETKKNAYFGRPMRKFGRNQQRFWSDAKADL